MMLDAKKFAEHAGEFTADGVSIERQLELANQVRDSIEIVHTAEYQGFLQHYFPVFQKLLSRPVTAAGDASAPAAIQPPLELPPGTAPAAAPAAAPADGAEDEAKDKEDDSADKEAQKERAATAAAAMKRARQESKLRKVLLEVLNRLPHNEFLRPYVQQLMALCLHVLEVDKEACALICLRIIFDLHKNFRPTLEDHVAPFLKFVCSLYEQAPNAAADLAKAVEKERTDLEAAAQAAAAAKGAAGTSGGASAAAGAAEGASAGNDGSGSGQQADKAKAEGAEAGAQAGGADAAAATGGAGTAATGGTLPSAEGGPGEGGIDGGISGSGSSSVSSADTPSKRSFKVVIECPLIVMFLFQLYPKHIGQNVNVLLPLMVNVIALKGPTQPIPATLRDLYSDFKAAQVKTVSFLTYLLRSCADTLRPHKDRVSQGIVDLLVTCPDNVATRKELLVATRHVLATEFRQGFHARIGTLLDEKVLVGSGRACLETLRPLGYSLLAELVHHVRLELSMHQLRRIVHLFSCNVHDPTLPTSVQTTCVRLMLNLVESIFTRRGDELSRAEGRALLGRILETFVSKLEALQPVTKELIKEQERLQKEQSAKASAAAEGAPKVTDGAGEASLDAGKASEADEKEREVLYLQQSVTTHAKDIQDCRALLRTLIMGMKTLMWSVTKFNRLTEQQRQQQGVDVSTGAAGVAGAVGAGGSGGAQGGANTMAPPPARGMSNDEVRIATGMLKHGVPCLSLFPPTDKEIFEHFAAMFTVLEPHNFRDIFSMHFDVLFQGMIENHALGTVPAALVAHPQTGRPFADVLGGYLASPKRLEILADPESAAARLSLKLISLLCSLVASMPNDADRLSRPHVGPLVMRLRKAIENGEPLGAFLDATRKLFRALAQTRSEVLYAEFVPLLPGTLQAVVSLLDSPAGLAHRAYVVETCLNMPARLASLMPHLSMLVRPVLLAIEKDESIAWSPPAELTQLGLRVCESWIDKLSPDFLEDELGALAPRVVGALWSLVRPPPFQFGAKALQLLGKLGGRSSRMIDESAGVQCKEYPEHGFRVLLTFAPSTPFLVPLDKVIAFVRRACIINTEPAARKASLRVLHACASAALGMRGKATAAKDLADALLGCKDAEGAGAQAAAAGQAAHAAAAGGARTRMQLLAESQVVCQILTTCISAAALPGMEDSAKPFNNAISTHLAMLSAGGYVKTCATQELEVEAAYATAAETANAADATNAAAAAGGSAATAAAGAAAGAGASADGMSSLPALPAAQTSLRELDPLIVLEAILEAAATPVTGYVDAAADAFERFTGALVLLWKGACERSSSDDPEVACGGAKAKGNIKEAIAAVVARLSHACYEEGWARRVASTRLLGMAILCLRDLDLLSLELAVPAIHAYLHVLSFCKMPAPMELIKAARKNLQGLMAAAFPARIVPAATEPAAVEASGDKQPEAKAGDGKEKDKKKDGSDEDKEKDGSDDAQTEGEAGGSDAPAALSEEAQKYLAELCKAMAVKLLTPATVPACRDACIEGLQHAARVRDVSVKELMEPYLEDQLKQVLARPFSSRPLAEQAGLADTLTFCMEQTPPLVAIDEKVVPILCEALITADQEMLATGGKNTRATPALEAVSLAAVRMLAASLALDSLTMTIPQALMPAPVPANPGAQPPPAPAPVELRSKAVSVFFLCLIRGRDDVAAPAKKGIQTALDRKNLPKELLQSSLRPILLNLATYRTLNLPLLNGLADLLSLLSAWFNKSLGEKLLEHLERWMYPERLAADQTAWKPGEDAKVAAAIIELFHLLPDVAQEFLPRLVPLVDGLERALPAVDLPSEVCSILEAPLSKYLCKYSSQSVDYFLDKLSDPQQYRRLVSVIAKPEGKELLEELLKSADKVLAVTFGQRQEPSGSVAGSTVVATTTNTGPTGDIITVVTTTEAGGQPTVANAGAGATAQGAAADAGNKEQGTAQPMDTDAPAPGSMGGAGALTALTSAHPARFEGIGLIAELVRLSPRWLLENPRLFDAVCAAWADPSRRERIKDEERLPEHQVHESERLLHCLVACVREDRTRNRLLFKLLSALTVSSRVDYTFVRELFSEDVAKKYSAAEQRAVLTEFLAIFKERALPQSELVLGLQHIVLPIIEAITGEGSENRASEVVDAEIVSGIVSTLLDPAEDVSAHYSESLRVELLQLATELIRKMPNELTPHRKELIKFGWNHLKRDGCSSKQWAFVNVCHFLEVYQAPEKIILQVFVALLRACQPEGRALVRKALDVLAPALPRRLSSGEHRFPIWIRYTKKILVEESHSMPHLIHIWQLVVRHPDLFYESRAQFVPQIINTLSRLGLPTNAPPENRRLALDLVTLVIDWEVKRKRLAASVGSAEGGAGDSATGSKRQREDGPAAADAEPDAKKTKDAAASGGQAGAEAAGTAAASAGDGAEGGAAMEVDAAGGAAAADGKQAQQQPQQQKQKQRKLSDWSLNAAMEELVMSFLTRMMFAAAEAKGKDREVTALYPHALAIFQRVVKMWPATSIRLNYLDKHFQHQNVPTSVLLAVLHVYNAALETQGSAFLLAQSSSGTHTNLQQIGNVLQRCFQVCDPVLHGPLASVCASVSCVPPQTGLDTLQQKLEEFTVQHLLSGSEASARQAQAQAQGNPLPPPPTEHCAGTKQAICASQILIALMEEVSKRGLLPDVNKRVDGVALGGGGGAVGNPAMSMSIAAPLTPLSQRVGRLMAAALKLLHRYGKERLWRLKFDAHTAAAQLNAPPSIAALDNVRRLLLLLCEQMPRYPALKKGFLQALVLLIQTGDTDPNALMAVLAVLRQWLRTGGKIGSPGALQTNEVVLFLQRLASIDRADTENVARREAQRGKDQSRLRAWKDEFLRLLEDLACAPDPSSAAVQVDAGSNGPPTSAKAGTEADAKGDAKADVKAGAKQGVKADDGVGTVPADLRRDAFDKVERAFMIGLRANDPEVRRKFFERYHAAIDTQLYARLLAIVGQQEWEAVSSTFWLTQAVRLLLAILKKKEPITLAPNSAAMPAIGVAAAGAEAPQAQERQPPAGAGSAAAKEDTQGGKPEGMDVDAAPKSSGPDHEGAEEGKGDDQSGGAPAESAASPLEELFEQHSAWLSSLSSLCVEDLIEPLEEIAHSDAQLSCSLWVIFFPITWAALDKQNQVQVVKPMIALLSKECHLRQAQQRPNVMQALLESISLSLPQPKVPSELIRFIGRTYNTWHVAIPMLESHVNLFPQDTRCFDALADLYRLLGEHDMIAGLWRKRCNAKETASGLALMQHGMYARAQDVFSNCLTQVYDGNFQEAMKKAEICLWEDSWVQCARQLNQWDQVAEFARVIDHSEMQLESLWKLGDWQQLRESVFPKAQCEETPALKCVTARAALQAGSVEAGDTAVRQGVLLALHRWWALPPVGVQAHADLLFRFQQLVELQESARVLVEIGHASRSQQHACTELKDILETWRLRLPNEWDSVERWSEMVHWRSHMHNVVINAFKDFHAVNPPLHQLGFRDKAWSVNRLAHIARKHGMSRVCVSVLNKMYGFATMEVQEAFVKICEQAKAHLGPPAELKQGMNLLNTTNLEYFPGQHKAEIFRLRGEMLQAQGDNEGARQAFSTAVSIFKRLPKGWHSWAVHCDKMSSEANAGSASGWLEHAVAAYAQAARAGSSKQRAAATRLMSMVALDACAGGSNLAANALSGYLDIIPLHVWLPWIPQLLVGLQRAEEGVARNILGRLAVAYPQALYCALRTSLLERQPMARSAQMAQQGKPASQHVVAQARAFDAAKECMERLRQQHGALSLELEAVLTELGSKFNPRPEERLLGIIDAFLLRCFKHQASSNSPPPPNFAKELGVLGRSCFSDEACQRHASFAKRYKECFEADFTTADKFASTLGGLQRRLKRWRSVLRQDVRARIPTSLRLEVESPVLAAYRARDLEMPGQYLDPSGSDVDVSLTAKLSHFAADVPIVRRRDASHRRVGLVGVDGRVAHFIVQTSVKTSERGDERALQLLRAVNRLLLKHPECRRRRLALRLPVVVPVWPQVRMVEDDADTVSLGEVYNLHCARYGRDPDQPVVYFKDVVSQAASSARGDAAAAAPALMAARKQAYQDISSKLISENLLNQYVYKTIPNGTHLWIFKRHFTSQLALWSLLGSALRVGGRTPARMLFSRRGGSFMHADFRVELDRSCNLEQPEAVPFRLTRNLQSFATPFGVEGLLVASMAASAQAVLGDPRKSQLRDFLALYFRDEVVTWDGRVQQAVAAATAAGQGPPNPTPPLEPGFVRERSLALASSVAGSLAKCVPSRSSGAGPPAGGAKRGQLSVPPVHAGVAELVAAAINPANIVSMDAVWHPWM